MQLNRFADELHRLFARLADRHAAGKIGNVGSEGRVALLDDDDVFHVILCLSTQRYHPNTYANTSGATIEASDSMTCLGVSTPSFPHVIFSFGTAPEYEP